MLWILAGTLLGAIIGAIAYRARGTARLKWYGRAACALLVSLPVAFLWPWGTAAYLPLAGLSLVLVGLPHDPSGRDWLLQARTGLAFTLPCAVVLAVLTWPGNLGSVLLVFAGAAKAACYLLPRREVEGMHFLWRELAFGACWGAAAGAAI